MTQLIPSEAKMVREWLAAAHSVAVLTGAGISAESGIPTFRGPGGLWRNFRAEDLATPEAFQRDPKMVWEWYDWRRSVIAKAEPNAGHTALAAMERRVPRFSLITQNVDGLHDRAGSVNILKVHGDIWTLRCTMCERERRDLRPQLPELPPRCQCGGMERPAVVWFGEGLPDAIWEESVNSAREADLFFVIGTAAVVHPAAGLVHLAKSSGAKVVEINIADTPVSGTVDLTWRAPAAEALPVVVGS
ncbi:MAG: NAD-dependent deacylase [Bryobacteraceae bacterium]